MKNERFGFVTTNQFISKNPSQKQLYHNVDSFLQKDFYQTSKSNDFWSQFWFSASRQSRKKKRKKNKVRNWCFCWFRLMFFDDGWKMRANRFQYRRFLILIWSKEELAKCILVVCVSFDFSNCVFIFIFLFIFDPI